MVRLLYRILLFHSPTLTLYTYSIYTRPDHYNNNPSRTLYNNIIHAYSVILRPAATASIPLAAPTPKCLGRTK